MNSADALTLSEAAALVARATVVLSLTWLGARIAMRRSASTRHAVWAAGFIAALALPLAARAVPDWSLAVLPASPIERAAVDEQFNRTVAPPRATHSLPSINVRATQSAPSHSTMTADASEGRWPAGMTTTGWVLLAWSVVGAALLLRYLVSLVAVFALTRRAEAVCEPRWRDELDVTAAALGLAREPRLVMTDSVTVPFTCGFLRPTLVVPSSALAWTDERIRVVLLHELAHVARRDCLVQAVVQTVCAVYWFHPLAWLGARHLRAERERACDDLVLAAGTRSAAYAEHLLDIARAATGTPRMAIAALAMARPSELEGRLLAILDRGRDRARAERGLLWKVAVLSAIVVLPLANVQLVARAVVPEPLVADAGPHGGTAVPADASATPTPTQTPSPSPTPSPAPSVGAAGGVSVGIAHGISRGIGSGVSGGVASGVAGGVAGGVATWMAGVDGEQDAPPPRPRREEGATARPIPPAVLQGLTEALKDSDAEVRKQAMQALARIHAPGMYDVIALALKDADPEVREQAAFALSQMGDQRAVPALVTSLKDTDADVRQQAAFALSQLRSTEAVPALSAALKDSDDDVREQALFALSQIRDASAVPAIMAALTDKADSVREQAAFALSQIGDSKAVPALVAALKDKEPSVRQQAAFALSQIGDESALEGLTAALKDADAEVRQQAVFALSQIAEGNRHNRYQLQGAPVLAPPPNPQPPPPKQ
jgi:HEAT repeat protein/beta-lactamase regulating signal transducer with metallopeptidase domain